MKKLIVGLLLCAAPAMAQGVSSPYVDDIKVPKAERPIGLGSDRPEQVAPNSHWNQWREIPSYNMAGVEPATPSPSPAPCAREPEKFSLIFTGSVVKDPGKATWHADGSWTVDWPTIEEVAALPAFVHNAAAFDNAGSPGFSGNIISGDVISGRINYSVDYVLVARSLLYERSVGHLVERPRSAEVDGCPLTTPPSK